MRHSIGFSSFAIQFQAKFHSGAPSRGGKSTAARRLGNTLAGNATDNVRIVTPPFANSRSAGRWVENVADFDLVFF